MKAPVWIHRKGRGTEFGLIAPVIIRWKRRHLLVPGLWYQP